MSETPSLEQFWELAPAGRGTFPPDRLAALPPAAQRYLRHAISPGGRLAKAVRLRMHGEIKLGRWLPFRAEQVIRWDRGMIWRATVRKWGLPIRGSDRFIDGGGSMRWRLLGVIPVMSACGPDVTRSAAGRLKAESIWLPSVLCRDEVSWTEPGPDRLSAEFPVLGETSDLGLTTDEDGALKRLELQRWGNPEGGAFGYAEFGGIVEAERTFDGYTIPTRMRAGWHFGTDRFEPEGEFFRVTIADASYR